MKFCINRNIRFHGLVIALLAVTYNYGCLETGRQRLDEESVLIPVPPPPEVIYSPTVIPKRPLRDLFKDCNILGQRRDLVGACNFNSNVVRNLSVNIAGQSSGEFNLGQICDVFDFCYSKWNYVNDPRPSDYFASASSTIKNGFNGDCDDFAVLVCSMILSIGGECRITFGSNGESAHAYTEVNLGATDLRSCREYINRRYRLGSESVVNIKSDAQGNQWLNLDWFAAHPGGEYFKANHGAVFYILQKYCEDF